MPKKHHQPYTKPSSNYVHPSLQISKPVSAAASSSSKTVNERLSQLRREQAPKANLQRKNEIANVVTQRTVPPALRQIMNIPETAPPKPKPGTRLPGRRPPGPAPPMSWLRGSLHAPVQVKEAEAHATRGAGDVISLQRMDDFSRLARLDDSPAALPPQRSLAHQVLKAMAVNWESVAEYEQYYLATLPVSLKSVLLSYIARYGPQDGVGFDTLKVLFFSEKHVAGATGIEDIKQLDFSSLIGHKLTMADLSKYFSASKTKGISNSLQRLSIADGGDTTIASMATDSDSPTKEVSKDATLESWEDEVEADTRIPIPLITARFPNLTRLSLAKPASTASWSHLLSLSTHLATLTHLSLAYWPTPSLTPNSTTASVTSNYGRPVAFGGTHYYSALDNDWHEAANILRRLSNNTYCLEWLDLEGCNDWLPALVWNSDAYSSERKDDGQFHYRSGLRASHALSPDNSAESHDGWAASRSRSGPDWNGSWGRVAYVNASQARAPAAYPQWLGRRKEAFKIERIVHSLRKPGSVHCQFDCESGEEGHGRDDVPRDHSKD